MFGEGSEICERNENYPMKKHIHRIRMQSMFEKHIKQKSLNIWKKAYASGIIGTKSVVAAVGGGGSAVVVVVVPVRWKIRWALISARF